jgi:hypothetical protein
MSSIFSKQDPPSPPNPIDTARAATGTNVATAVANANLQNINQVTPGGALNYSTTGNFSWTDPTTGQTYSIPQFTATQTLGPQQQAIQNQQLATQLNLANMANTQSGRIAGFLAQPMNTAFNSQQYLSQNPDVARWAAQSGLSPDQAALMQFNNYGNAEGRTGWQAPTGGNASNISGLPAAATSFASFSPQAYLAANPDVLAYAQANGLNPTQFAIQHYNQYGVGENRAGTNQIQSSLGAQGDITKTYGPADNFSADRQRVEDSLMARMNPQLQIEKQGIQQQLADQGIRYGSQAYSDAMMNYSRQADDARFAAINQAGTEQQRMVTEAAQQAAFQNAAQQQGYEQQLGAGQFANAAQGQLFGQNAQMAQFGNLGLAQQLQQQQAAFNAAQAQQGAYLQQQYAQRNQPLNEIAALLSGSQVQQPNFINTPGAQIPTTDVAGLVNQNFAQQLGIYQQQSTNQNQLIGGLLGFGAGALKASDRRIKENIAKMGTVFAANDEGENKKLPIYAYSYKDDPASTQHIGPMAQDVEKITPQAVEQHDGRKYIKPRQVMGSILKAG